MTKALTLTDELYDYLVEHCTPPDPLVAELIERTRAILPEQAKMQVAPEQAGFLRLLVGVMGAREIVEVGTFTGLSALSMASALPATGKLITFDISTEYTELARDFWRRAGVADRIELRIGPAVAGLRELPTEPRIDFAFIDADKPNYYRYWQELVPRMRPGGLLAVDNVLWDGRVLEAEPTDERTRAIIQFNQDILADDRVELVMLPIADGITLARRR
ncbi:class I SAM-dependent methyltransferase [Natronosporangium hydrolyticum]|uniref:Class I SAM-dependent methyltransferase n=1 Tax=Natronosporangium hydrolyticum TaxID=2811111 RepID=A0A895Y8S1_9ACTN|nr:class I SAM-dependent methyltransferase [Natronosporangium hydrolyticum]QSB12662.1 class I SAM-dependent methyltransferase [Natronosporangium hydrolyticum]